MSLENFNSNSKNINCKNINCKNINCKNINCKNINCKNIITKKVNKSFNINKLKKIDKNSNVKDNVKDNVKLNNDKKKSIEELIFKNIEDLLKNMDGNDNNKVNNIKISRIDDPSKINFNKLFTEKNNENVKTFFLPYPSPELVEENEITQIKNDEFILDNNKEYVELDLSLNSIDAIIELGKRYDPETFHKYTINLKKLNLLIPTLEKLKQVIGMEEVKKNIINQIVYFMSGFGENENMLHTVILGPPGVGKTMLGHIIGEVYFKLGIIKNQTNSEYKFKIARRSDLIGQYLGHTAIKTQKIIDECQGGILFIDEAYSLGSDEKTDIYSKECIDTLNQNLTENKKNFVCIIAGYPDQLERCFFSINPGLKRRFPFKYSIEKYNHNELAEIFEKMMNSKEWFFDSNYSINKLKKFIEHKYDDFKNFGGDMETLFFNVKIAHALRVAGKHPLTRKYINQQDIENGFNIFKISKNDKNILPSEFSHIYI